MAPCWACRSAVGKSLAIDIRTVGSPDAEASRVPSGLKATESTQAPVHAEHADLVQGGDAL